MSWDPAMLVAPKGSPRRSQDQARPGISDKVRRYFGPADWVDSISV